MAEIHLFRTYPAPGESWRPWDVSIDGAKVVRIGGAGFKAVQARGGAHRISVAVKNEEAAHIDAEVHEGRPSSILIGNHFNSDRSRATKAPTIGISLCDDMSELPRGAIPTHPARGGVQTLSQGRNRAVWGLAVLGLVDLVFWWVAISIIVSEAMHGLSFQLIFCLFSIAMGFWLARVAYPGFRMVKNQWFWPLENWRVGYKGEEREEWKRWSNPSAKEA